MNNFYKEQIREFKKRLMFIDENKYYLYMDIATSYRHLKQYKEALRYTQHAIREAETDHDFMQCNWSFGNIYTCIGNKRKAMRFFNRCLVHYSRNNDLRRMGDILKNISRLAVSVQYAKEAIEVFERGLNVNLQITQDTLDDAYDNLHDIYNIQGNYLESYRALQNIKNRDLRQNLQEKLICLQQAN